MKTLEEKFKDFFNKVKDATYLNKNISFEFAITTSKEAISVTYIPLSNVEGSTVITYYRDNGEITIKTHSFDLTPVLRTIWEGLEPYLEDVYNSVEAGKVARIKSLKEKKEEIINELKRLENEK